MRNDPRQLVAQLTLALVLLLVAGLLLSRMLRTIPGAGWVALPFPGRGLLRRTLVLLVLLVLVGLLLDALTVEDGRERRRLPVFVVEAKKTPGHRRPRPRRPGRWPAPDPDPGQRSPPAGQPAGGLRALAPEEHPQLR